MWTQPHCWLMFVLPHCQKRTLLSFSLSVSERWRESYSDTAKPNTDISQWLHALKESRGKHACAHALINTHDKYFSPLINMELESQLTVMTSWYSILLHCSSGSLWACQAYWHTFTPPPPCMLLYMMNCIIQLSNSLWHECAILLFGTAITSDKSMFFMILSRLGFDTIYTQKHIITCKHILCNIRLCTAVYFHKQPKHWILSLLVILNPFLQYRAKECFTLLLVRRQANSSAVNTMVKRHRQCLSSSSPQIHLSSSVRQTVREGTARELVWH